MDGCGSWRSLLMKLMR